MMTELIEMETKNMTNTYRITDKPSKTEYVHTYKIEILREYGNSIYCAFKRYASETNSLKKAATETFKLIDSLYKMNDDELSEAETKLDTLQNYLYEVNPDAII